MMADLQTELVVTLGDTKVDSKLEEQLMAENNKWECYKLKHGIKNWVPIMEKTVALAPVFMSMSMDKSIKKGQKRKNMADPVLEGSGAGGGSGANVGGRSNKKVKRVARLTSSPRKTTGRKFNMTL